MYNEDMIGKYFDSLMGNKSSKVYWSWVGDQNSWDDPIYECIIPQRAANDVEFKVIPPGSTPVFSFIGAMKTIIIFSGRE